MELTTECLFETALNTDSYTISGSQNELKSQQVRRLLEQLRSFKVSSALTFVRRPLESSLKCPLIP
jgi:mevalonate pyrophosphate decarboxylase